MALQDCTTMERLFEAVENEDLETIREWLHQCKYFRRETLLKYVCERGKLSIVKVLMSEFEVDINIKDPYGCTPLLTACGEGHLDIVKVLVTESNADLSAREAIGRTALMLAVRGGHEDVVIALLRDYQCPVTDTDKNGWGVLHYACASGSVSMVQTLIHYMADANLQYKNNEIPLQLAISRGFFDVAVCLIRKFNCNPNVADEQGQTPLHYVCKKRDTELVHALVHDHKANLNSCDKLMKTPLHVAVEEGNSKAVLALVGCDPNPADMEGETPLHYACRRGDINTVHTLVKDHKANVNACDNYKNTPLHVAVNIKVAQALVGCDPNMENRKGQSPLHLACKRGDKELVDALVKDHKANVNACDNYKNTPLHMVVNKKVALALVGCDPNMANREGQTPLHLACKKGDKELIDALVCDHKADINACDKDMLTPLHMALYNLDIVYRLISEFGCDPNVRDIQGKTLLHHACESGDLNVIRALLHDHKADATECDKYGNTPLHMAASAGHSKVATALVNEYGCDPTAQGYRAKTPLHIASQAGHHKTVQTLLKFTSPLVTDEQGNTPLHLASELNRELAMRCLLEANAPVLKRNDNGLTTLDVAGWRSESILHKYIQDNHQQILADYKNMSEHAKKKLSGSHNLTRLFVIGNPGAGKSSFIESLKRDSFFQSFSKVSESSVPPHTAGIIPSVHMSKQYGRVLFYDFAGDPEYYASHAAIFESLASAKRGNNIFIIVVDMQDVAMETTLYYWFTFIDYQKFRNASFIVVGSHLDKSAKQIESLDQFCASMQPSVHDIKHFMLDCRDPRSNQIAQFKKQISTWVCKSQKYELSNEARLLLGLLEKDFSAVTACPVQTLVSHIKQAGVWLPVEPKLLYPFLLELHEVGVVLLLGDCTKDTDHVILNTAKLTNQVHKLLFAESAISNIKQAKRGKNFAFLNIGILPQNVLEELLPPYITTECLVHLQYCQKILHDDVRFFPCFEQTDSTSQSFLFFSALCSVDKSQVSWDESTDASSFTIGWLTLCTRPHDYFPPRFLHVLLLRLVYGFTLFPERLLTAHTSNRHIRSCNMWKKGVHWRMEEGVDCMVELVNGSKGVVVLSKSSMDGAEVCGRVFTKVVSCVMEAKAEFCYSTKPEFYILDSSDYLNEDHLFAVSDVGRALESPEEKRVIYSVSHKEKMELSKLQCMRKLTHWGNFFPIDFDTVLHVLREIVKGVYELGQSFGAPHYILQAIEADFPYDVSKRRRELVRWWMSSSQDPPCWYHLVQALRRMYWQKQYIKSMVFTSNCKKSYCVKRLKL